MPEPHEHHVRDKEVLDLPWGGKLVFYNCIVGGVIDQRFIPSIQKGIMEKMHEGPVTGSYVRDIRVIVYDGKMHPVDSNDISFKIAGMMAFMKPSTWPSRASPSRCTRSKSWCPKNRWATWSPTSWAGARSSLGMDSKRQVPGHQSPRPPGGTRQVFHLPTLHHTGPRQLLGKFLEYAPVPGEIQRKLAEGLATEQH